VNGGLSGESSAVSAFTIKVESLSSSSAPIYLASIASKQGTEGLQPLIGFLAPGLLLILSSLFVSTLSNEIILLARLYFHP
jgi:hypothetical protein